MAAPFCPLSSFITCTRIIWSGFITSCILYLLNPYLFFNSLNQRLAKSDYIAGDRFTVADITAFISLEFAKFIKEKPSEDAIHLQRWYSAIALRKCAKV